MTVAPQSPIFDSTESPINTLIEPHLTIVDLGLGLCLLVYIRNGYLTDGATIPKEKLEDNKIVTKLCEFISCHYPGKEYQEVLDYLVGTPFEMPRILAALVHDALYGMHWAWRWVCDRVYKKILSNLNYDSLREEIEYIGIRWCGEENWDAITKEEIKHTKKMVDVELFFSWNKEKKIEKYKKMEL